MELQHLQERLDFESLVTELSARLVQVTTCDVDRTISDALRRISEFFGCDRCGMMAVDTQRQLAWITHIYCADGIPGVSGERNRASLFPWARQLLIDECRPCKVTCMETLPPEAAADVTEWRKLGIKSLLDIPIRSSDGIRYIMAMNTVREERSWPDEYIPRLRLLGEIFVTALERKRADEAIRSHEARLSLAADSADAGLWELDLKSQCIWATPKTYELYGLECGSAVKFDDFVGLIYPEDRERVRFEIETSIQRRGDFVSEYRITLPEGDVRWMAVRARVIGHAGADPDALAGISVDITPRKVSELALRAAHEEIQQLKDRLQLENVYLRQEVKNRSDHFAIVGQSRALRKVLYQIEQVAPTNAVVLLEGETGTGKELIAHAIHEASPRRERPLVCVNCGAIPAALIESELFGREKGAYTGALAKQIGRFELADGSTILLDEVSELPLDLQVKLLRVLQERTFERLGNPKPVAVNVRIIAATNRDLSAAVRDGRFRQDLYYRLNVFPIHVPPLRERLEDIPLLAWAFVEEFNKAMGKAVDSITRESIDAMVSYPWTGNIRELRNIVERAMILSTGPCLRVELPTLSGAPAGGASMRLTDVESDHIRSVLRKTNGRIRGKNGAAELLGLNPSTLESRMLKLGIRRESQ